MTSKKLKLLGSGNQDGRSFFIFNKEASFFPRFSLFLIGCGFKDLGIYEDYAEEKQEIKEFNNYIDNLKNEEYDIDLIITVDRIILIVRHDIESRNKLVAGIKRILKS